MLGTNISDKFRGSDYSSLAKKITVSGQEVFIDPLYGPVITDYLKRSNKRKFTTGVIEKLKTFSNPSVVISGWWYNEIKVRLLKDTISRSIEIIDYADENTLNRLKSEGKQIYFLPEIDRINDRRYGREFTLAYAMPFPY